MSTPFFQEVKISKMWRWMIPHEKLRVEWVYLLCFLFQPVGCDLIVNSTVRKDRCGICDGDNSTCDVIQNTFTAQPRKNSKTFRG